MGRHHRAAPRRLTTVRLLLAVVACLGVVVALWPPPDAPAAAPAAEEAVPAPVMAGAMAAAGSAVPTRVQVPSIGVDSSLAALGVDATGALVPPADFAQAGWFAPGIVPGDVGPAVVAGHVDSRAGPAVFFRLRELETGDEVVVSRDDGTTVRFAVTAVARYPKDAFPTAEVYGPTADPQLRLITCGGDFDRGRRSYADNVVVYARLT